MAKTLEIHGGIPIDLLEDGDFMAFKITCSGDSDMLIFSGTIDDLPARLDVMLEEQLERILPDWFETDGVGIYSWTQGFWVDLYLH